MKSAADCFYSQRIRSLHSVFHLHIFEFANFHIDHSLRKLFTGLANAAFMALYPTVIQAIRTEPAIATIKNQMLNGMRYTKLFNQLCIIYQATGTAIKKEMMIKMVNSFENSCSRLVIDAPNTFRMPTSFVFCTAIKETSPYKPKQDIKMANPAKIL